jgi:hypothetical protein
MVIDDNKQLTREQAEEIGPIDDGPDTDCERLDVLKHLTSDYIKKKLNT